MVSEPDSEGAGEDSRALGQDSGAAPQYVHRQLCPHELGWDGALRQTLDVAHTLAGTLHCGAVSSIVTF